MPLSRGARLGPYEILSPLGAGGMGEVYRARDPRIGRDVAIKVIASEEAPESARVRRFADEARAAGSISHPNILSVFDVGLEGDSPYLVFELLEGETLRVRLARGPLPPRKVIDLGVQIAGGLAAANEKGIVHRDLKPENLFVTRDGRAKILDFGLAKLRRVLDQRPVNCDAPTAEATGAGAVLGTVGYMSPEQVRGQRADHRSDIFSFGAVLYEMLSGRQAFRGDSAVETMSAILTEDAPEPSRTTASIPQTLDRIVRRCLEKNPEERFQSARDLAFALAALSDSLPIETAAPTARPRAGARWPLVVGAGVALAVAAAAYSKWPRGAPSSVRATVTPFTSFVGQEVAPSFSPDGSEIAFAWSSDTPGRNDQFELYVKVVGSEKVLRLTTHPASSLYPAWSPDGRVIAFSRATKGESGIFVVPALGGPERKLTDMRFSRLWRGMALSWSPDGRLRALSDADATGKLGISLLNVDTLEKHRLSQPSRDCRRTWLPAFSPDGGSLAVVCVMDENVEDLFVVPVSGGSAAREVARVDGETSGLSWTVDGKDLVFANGGLFRVSASGGEPSAIAYGRDAAWPAVSRIGHRLAYVQQSTNTNIWRVRLAGRTRPAAPAVKVVSSTRMQRFPALSPDGSRLAFESTRSGAQEIWISSADGSDPVRLTSYGGPLSGSPRWSPDGRQVAFDSRISGHSSIYLIGVDGGPPRRLETGVADSSVPSWSRDGRWLYFSVDQPRQVWKVQAGSGTTTPMTKEGGFFPQESADGKSLYYVKDVTRPEMWSVSVDGGDEQPLSGMPSLGPRWATDWAPTASGIYFIDGESPRPGLAFFDLETRKVQRVMDLPGRPEPWGGGLVVSHDGQTVFFSQLDEIASDIMVVENFDSH